MVLAVSIRGDFLGAGTLKERGLVTISQVRWREGVKEEIPNLLPYHAKAQSKINLLFSIASSHQRSDSVWSSLYAWMFIFSKMTIPMSELTLITVTPSCLFKQDKFCRFFSFRGHSISHNLLYPVLFLTIPHCGIKRDRKIQPPGQAIIGCKAEGVTISLLFLTYHNDL